MKAWCVGWYRTKLAKILTNRVAQMYRPWRHQFQRHLTQSIPWLVLYPCVASTSKSRLARSSLFCSAVDLGQDIATNRGWVSANNAPESKKVVQLINQIIVQ